MIIRSAPVYEGRLYAGARRMKMEPASLYFENQRDDVKKETAAERLLNLTISPEKIRYFLLLLVFFTVSQVLNVPIILELFTGYCLLLTLLFFLNISK